MTTKTFSSSDVAKHTTRADCWISIEHNVYDVSKFIALHPGGVAFLTDNAGKDVTALFFKYHHRDVLAKYNRLVVGALSDYKPTRKVVTMPGTFGDMVPYGDPSWYQRMKSPYYKPTHIAFRARVREFVDNEILPTMYQWCEKDQPPHEIYKKMGLGTWHFSWTTTRGESTGNIERPFKKGVMQTPDAATLDGYDGGRRYGVPHGHGALGAYVGSWRAALRHGIGTLVTEDGTYEGDWYCDVRHGYGTQTSGGGAVTYVGEWNVDKRHGVGRLELLEEVYEGSFEDGMRVGYGKASYKGGSETYEGGWLADRYHGMGSLHGLEYDYEGPWRDGCRHGERGKCDHHDGATSYVGAWCEDTMHGQGQFFLQGIGRYDGDFDRNARSGEGIFTFLDGTTLQGQWVGGALCGHGLLKVASEDALSLLAKLGGTHEAAVFPPICVGSFEGEFLGGLMHGQGTMTFLGGGTYAGTWSEGQLHGHGEMTYSDRSVYRGAWRHGMRHGGGDMVYPDGRRFAGMWAGDDREGDGTVSYADGRVVKGSWRGGAAVQLVEVQGAALMVLSPARQDEERADMVDEDANPKMDLPNVVDK